MLYGDPAFTLLPKTTAQDQPLAFPSEKMLWQKQQEPPVSSHPLEKKRWRSWIPHLQVKVLISLSVTFIALFAFAYLFHSWRDTEQRTPTTSPSPSLVKVGQLSAPLTVRLAVMKRQEDTVSVLKEGEILASGDYYGVFFEPAQESFVYILQQDATGKIDILFPDPQVTPQTNPVPAGKAVWVPQDEKHWFYLDQNKGREVIIVVASSQRDEKLEFILQSLNDVRSQGALADWMVAPERGRGGVKRLETTPRFSPEGKSLDLETALVQGNGTDFVYKVAFQHK